MNSNDIYFRTCLFKTFLSVVFFFGSFSAVAQNDIPKPVPENEVLGDNDIYDKVETRPEFPGGIQAFYDFVAKNYRAPNVKGLKGKVFVQFVIEKDGSLSDIKVLRDIGHGTRKEAIRVLKKSPKWIPAEKDGKKVRVLYSFPITINSQ
jgi:protein TonB